METNRRIAHILLVITACLLVTKVFCQEPTLKILPRSPIATAGNSFAFQCRGSSDGDDDDNAFTDMKWVNANGQTIPEVASPGYLGPIVKKQSPNSLKLYFPKAFLDDSGNYTCSAVYRNTITVESSVSITFYEDMTWGECEEKQHFVLGGEGRVFCQVSGNPAPTISWEKDFVKLISSDRVTIHRDGITISEVQKDDGGKYKIEAFVPLTGMDQMKNIEVEVYIPPVIKQLDNEFRTIEGEEYTIECRADGYPRPRYTWYDKESRNLSEIEGYYVNPDEGTLTIRKVERKAGGLYRCFVQNPAGESEESVKLIVLVKPTIEEFKNLTAKEGDSTTMICKANGNPEPTISIRKNNSPNPFGENQDNRVELQTMREGKTMVLSLKINQVERQDDGIYYCAASNDAGRVETVGQLEIQYKPSMQATPTEVMTWAGNPANLSCIAEANPNATITWKYQNEVIQPEDPRYVIYGTASYSNLLVKIQEVPTQGGVFGKYECEARNQIGENSIEIELKLATAPGPLSQVLFDRVTSTTITFKFLGPSFDGGLPVQGYNVKYWIQTESEALASEYTWTKESPFILSNLKPRMTYTFKVAARNVVGVGEWVRKTYQMPMETSPEIPSFLNEEETVSENPFSFRIKWTIPEDNGQPIEYFDIRYFQVEREIDGWKQLTKATSIKIENWANPEFDLINLQPNTYYKVEIRAHNKLGNSFPGHLVFKTGGVSLSDPMHKAEEDSLTLPVIVGIALAAVLLLLILLDVTCYMRFHCGLFYLMRYHTCGRSGGAKKVQEDGLEEGKACVKEVSTANNGKIRTEIKLPSPKAISPIQNNSDKAFKTDKQDGDNPAFDNRKPASNGDDIVYRSYPYEESPMMQMRGNHTRPADLIIDENYKNKSPKGSKSSIGKSSPV